MQHSFQEETKPTKRPLSSSPLPVKCKQLSNWALRKNKQFNQWKHKRDFEFELFFCLLIVGFGTVITIAVFKAIYVSIGG